MPRSPEFGAELPNHVGTRLEAKAKSLFEGVEPSRVYRSHVRRAVDVVRVAHALIVDTTDGDGKSPGIEWRVSFRSIWKSAGLDRPRPVLKGQPDWRRLAGMDTIKRGSRNPKGASASARSPRRPVVLHVDDEPVVRDILRLMLEQKLGVEVVEAGSSEQALRIAKRRKLSLVVTDHVRPGMDGLTFLREFKTQHPHVPVVIYSGQAARIRHRARRLGASGCVSKPTTLAKVRFFERALR